MRRNITVPPHPDATAADAGTADASTAELVDDSVAPRDPQLGLWWQPRRPLPAKPTLADVLCIDDAGHIQLDAVADPDAPSVTNINAITMRACAHGTCRDVTHAADEAFDSFPDTDGNYVVFQTLKVLRVADSKPLYQLKNPYTEDPDEFSCQVSGFLGPSILALGHDCGGPIAMPWLLDAATGRPIAPVRFADEKFIMDGVIHVLHLDGMQWAVVPVNGDSCFALILDARTGVVSERLTCTPKPARVIGRKKISFTPVACAGDAGL